MKNNKSFFKYIFWIAFGIILFLNLLLWSYLNNIEKELNRSLKLNLISENRSVSRLLDIDLLLMIIPGERNSIAYISLLQNLEEIRKQDELQSVSIISLDSEILVSSPEALTTQKKTSKSESDYFRNATNGIIGTSPIETINEEKFITSYGPVMDIDESVVAVLVIEAKATYFETMGTLRNRFLLYSLLTISAIVAIALILLKLINRTIQYQNTIRDQQHLAQLGTLGATVAHEIRNPLGIIEGSNELIKKKYGNPADEIFNYIPAEIKRLTEIIESFLNFARTPSLKISVFSLENLLSRIKIGIPKNKIESTLFFYKENLELKSDYNLLEQALLNVIINAIEVGIENKLVKIVITKEGKNIIFRVSDSGPGIEKNMLDNIFNPFFTTKEKGTGLGLAATKRIIELLKGDISVETAINSGTTFIIKIPQNYN
jgi:signal transduction histidine kinase